MERSIRLLRKGTVEWEDCVELLGLGVLSEHLHAAAQYFIQGTFRLDHVSGAIRQDRCERNQQLLESVAFVQGTGLSVVLGGYGFDHVDPDVFRETFFEWVDYQKRCGRSAH